MRLYEIVEELIKLESTWFDEETGEINEGLEKQLEGVKIDFDLKLENIWKMLKNYDSEINVFKDEVDRLNKRKKVIEKKQEWLKRYASQALEPGKKWSSKSGLAVYNWRKSTQTHVFAEQLLSEEYIEIIKKPILTAIKNAIKSGKKVDGAELIEKQNLSIK